MKHLKPVRWKEGMFLRPQHLQQYDLYLESREATRFEMYESHGWGLVHLELNESSLRNFVLSVERLRAVLPDGTLVDVPGNAVLPERPFDESVLEPGRPLQVSVGVRLVDPNQAQVPLSTSDDGHPRYRVVDEEVNDLDLGRDPVPIERLDYNLRFFLGDDASHGFEVFPLVRLVRTSDRAQPVRTDPKYSPPAMLLKASPVLHGITRGAYEALVKAVGELGKKRDPNKADTSILYQSLAGCLPVLKDMVKDGLAHPHDVYLEMSRLAGSLFYRDREGRSPDVLPPYDHRNPGPGFENLHDEILKLSEVVYEERYRRLPMERQEDGFACPLPGEIVQAGCRHVLEVHADQSMPRVKTLLMAAKISNPERISTLRDYALPGVPTEPCDPPAELGPGQTASYFRLKTEHDEWSTHVVPSGNLRVHVIGAPEDVKMTLVTIFPK